jgi:hypothetical protein
MKNSIILLCLFLSGCVTNLPPEPTWQEITKDPFIARIGINYLVSDEYVKLSEQRKIYIDRIKKYKETTKKH